MRNDERYGKGKSWDIKVYEDGELAVRMSIDAYAWKDHLEITIEHVADTSPFDIGEFLSEVAGSLKRLASGEIKPEWTAINNQLLDGNDPEPPW